MQYFHQDILTNASLVLSIGESKFEHNFFEDTLNQILTIESLIKCCFK